MLNVPSPSRSCGTPKSVESAGHDTSELDRILSASHEILLAKTFQWRTSSGRPLERVLSMSPKETKNEGRTKDFDDDSDEMIDYLLQQAEANLSSPSSMDAQPMPRLKYVSPAT